ncbi:MAG: hypothetical protein AAF567_19025 [Actinomycetota bacterium]
MKLWTLLNSLVDSTPKRPVTASDIVDATGLNERTVKVHLFALIGEGWVDYRAVEPSGRGRPPRCYWLTEEGRSEVTRYLRTQAEANAFLGRLGLRPSVI